MCQGQEKEQAIPTQAPVTQQAIYALDAVLGSRGTEQVPADGGWYQSPCPNDSLDHLHHCR
jgi:hypothetical protein